MDKATTRQLGIKLGTLKRITKEFKSYVDEVKENQEKLDAMSLDDDKYRQQADALNESNMMVGDAQQRQAAAAAALREFLETNEASGEMKDEAEKLCAEFEGPPVAAEPQEELY